MTVEQAVEQADLVAFFLEEDRKDRNHECDYYRTNNGPCQYCWED